MLKFIITGIKPASILLTNSFASILYICQNSKFNEADLCHSVLCDLGIILFQEK